MKSAAAVAGVVLAAVIPQHHVAVHSAGAYQTTPTVVAVEPRPSRPHPTPSASRSYVRVAVLPAEWLALGQCEASGKVDANTGNGFSGLFQFRASTWTGHGGGRFSAYAWQATAMEQLVIAHRVLADQGVVAWPICGPRVGLKPGD